MNYPQLFLPKGLVENFDKVFPLPMKPVRPLRPNAPENGAIILGSVVAIVFSSILFFIGLEIFGLIIIVGSLFSIFSNSDKSRYENELRSYELAISSFNKNLKEYEEDIKTFNNQNYQLKKRNQSNEVILSSSSKHIIRKDYKKGVSHNYFRGYLAERFGDSIIENVSIDNQRYLSYHEKELNLYITDFAYIDKYTNLKIDIEIDEPYTFQDKQPVHLNDKDRNDFFLKNNWIVIRFAEEQVINHPELCCEYIAKIIHCFDCDFIKLKTLKSNIPEVQKWNSVTVKNLISSNYRDSYLNGKIYFKL